MCRRMTITASRFSRFPAYVSASRLTSGSPTVASQSRTKLRPMKPAPPVTRIMGIRVFACWDMPGPGTGGKYRHNCSQFAGASHARWLFRCAD